MFGIVILQALYLTYLNKRNNKRRAAMGKTGVNVDYSLEDSSKWAGMRAKQAAEGGQAADYNAHAFEDLTDLNNEDFVYSL
jgi:hypothetical protein